jgi:hypothetical protein
MEAWSLLPPIAIPPPGSMRSAGRLGLASLPSLAEVEHQGKEEVAEESEEYWGALALRKL